MDSVTGGDHGPTPDRESLVPDLSGDDRISAGRSAARQGAGQMPTVPRGIYVEADEATEAETEGLSETFWRLFFWDGI